MLDNLPNPKRTFYSVVTKRILDIILSGTAIVILIPVFLVTAILELRFHGWPIIYCTKRPGKDGNIFKLYKFRSMTNEIGEDGWLLPEEKRLTKFGRIIRKTSIDELPELFNILKGDMSIIGPRPERVEHVQKYCKEIPEFSYRFKVKGGLTGYAQVYGKYNTTAYDKLKMDLIYIVNYSVLLDFRILLETVKVIFKKESTEGFQKEQVNMQVNRKDTKEEEKALCERGRY